MIKNKIFLLSLAFMLAMSLPYASAVYEIDFYRSSSAASPNTALNPSFLSPDTCTETTIEGSVTFLDSSHPTNVINEYYSPLDNLIITGSRPFDFNATCYSFTPFNTSEINTTLGTSESKTIVSHDADSLTNYIKTTYTCDEGVDLFYNIDMIETDVDSIGNVPNIYQNTKIKNCVVPVPYTDVEFTINLQESNFQTCATTEVNPLERGQILATGAGSSECVGVMYYFPIRSGDTGQVDYDVDCGNPANSGNCMNDGPGTAILVSQKWLLYPLDDRLTITTLSALSTASGSITLIPNKDYVFAFFRSFRQMLIGQTIIGDGFPSAEIDIYAYSPDYSDCDPFGECINGTRSQVCRDVNGINPPIFNYETCELIILENTTLGFEHFVTETDIKKCVPTWFLGCNYAVTDVIVDRPENWTVVEDPTFKQNFVLMSQDWATEGSRSIKLWYIPPTQSDHPADTSPNPSCVDLDSGLVPQIFVGVNDTTFLSINITFPAENMLIKYDTKKCEAPQLKHSALKDIFDFSTLCPERCYAANCSTEPTGRYVFNILDTVTQKSLLGSPFYDDAELVTKTPTFDLSDLGIVVNRTYNIVFAVFPDNLNDQRGDCVYFDNVQYQVTDRSLTELVGVECISRCVDTTRLEASLLPNGNCLVQEVLFSPICLNPEQKTCVENLETCCLNDNEVLQLNPKTSKYETILCGTGTTCVDGACTSDEEIEEVEDSTEPAEDSGEFLAWFSWLFSPLFIFLVISLVLGGIVSKAVTSGNKDGKGSFEVFGVVMIVMLIIGTLPGIAIVPVWISIAIIVFISLMIAQVMGIFAGRGG